jgi:hypothetical protein
MELCILYARIYGLLIVELCLSYIQSFENRRRTVVYLCMQLASLMCKRINVPHRPAHVWTTQDSSPWLLAILHGDTSFPKRATSDSGKSGEAVRLTGEAMFKFWICKIPV